MKVSLNLSTAPQENRRPFVAGSIVLGLVGVVALVLLSRAAYASWESNREVRSQIAAAQARIRATSSQQALLAAYFRGSQARQITDRADFLNSLIDERSFPWTRIFQSLEETLPDGVRVVSIAPRLVNGRAEVTLAIGAANDQQKIKFLQAIEKSKAFSNLEITSERRDNKADSLDQILLQLKVVYETT
jgi:Tfp pilus assembly protein PilN